MKNRAGRERTNVSCAGIFKSFLPNRLPPNPPLQLDGEGLNLLTAAQTKLNHLAGVLSSTSNLDSFLPALMLKEALASSQIDGSKATLEDVFTPTKTAGDVIQLSKAMDYALERLNQLPICSRLLKETNALLFRADSGQARNPGAFRYPQSLCTPQTGEYIPPVAEDVVEAMSDLEKYLNSDDQLDVLLKAGLIHYQIVTIAPFFDGNGRIARLLIELFLIDQGVLKSPVLSVSPFLQRNQITYFHSLAQVRYDGNFEQWIKFFLEALARSAENAVTTISRLSQLNDKNLAIVREIGQTAPDIWRLFSYIEANPLIETARTAVFLNLPEDRTADIINRLVSAGILTAAQNNVYAYQEFLNILKDSPANATLATTKI